jgi:cytochrome P450
MLDEAPAKWGDPHAFDGFRFYKLRSNPEDANRFQFASPSYDSMQFGFGNDACPGRFFASNQIKIILAYMLSHYDFMFEDGVVGRPKNIMFEVNVLADPTVKVLFKKCAELN